MPQKEKQQQVVFHIFPNGGWKLALGGGGLMLAGFLALLYRVEFGIILLSASGLVMAGGLVKLLLWSADNGWRLFHGVRMDNAEYRMRSAEARKMELSAGVYDTYTGTYFLDLPPTAYHHVPPTMSERKLIASPGTIKTRPDLLAVLTQLGNTYSLAGPQRSGKTWQAGHVADHWLSLGIQPVVICSKLDNPGYEWTGCQLIVSEDADELSVALRGMLKQMSDRHQLMKASRTPLPLILDDWMATMIISRDATFEFMSHAATKLASAGIITYFIMQSDTAGAYGVRELGAMLKNNFTRLNVIPRPAASGIIEPGISRGELIYPSTREGVKVDLMPGRPACFPRPPAEAEPEPPILALTDDDKIKTMIVDGLSNHAICKEMDWNKGGSKYSRIDAIRDEIAENN